MIEQYIQEIGQAGRDGEPSTAVLLYGSPGKHIKQNMKKYGENKRNCRRQLLYKDFLFYHNNDHAQSNCFDLCDSSSV